MLNKRKWLILFIALVIVMPALAKENITPAEKIYDRMTLDEKIGQLLLPAYRLLATSVKSPVGKEPGYLCKQALNGANENKIIKDCGLDQIAKYHVGAVLQDGGPNYNEPSLKNWSNLNQLAHKVHQNVTNDPLLLIGNDAIHGNSHVAGAVIFPHNINLGVTHDKELVQTIGQLTADDSLSSGFNWVYMPTVAVAHDLRWGRTYESFCQQTDWVKILANAYITGFQQLDRGKITGVLATAKHFIGDGGTEYGLDEGNVRFIGDQKQFWMQHGKGYEGAIQAGVGSLMVSYNAINENRMHFGGEWNILGQFINEGIKGADQKLYKFSGFTVSDYNGPTRAAYFYNLQHPSAPLKNLPEIFAKAINAGVDMIMLGNSDTQNPFDPNSPFNYTSVGEAAGALKTAYRQGLISEDRLKSAVTNILTVKLSMNSHPIIQPYTKLQEKERQIALQGAEESLVLLKNQHHVLPLKMQTIKNIVFLGETNDLGVQNGGWTINWQGQKTDVYFSEKNKISSGANTIEQAFRAKLSKQIKILHATEIKDDMRSLTANNTIVITAVAEPPYAEYMGDIGNSFKIDEWYKKGIDSKENSYMPATQSQFLGLKWTPEDAQMIQKLLNKSIPVITIIYSGRPVIITEDGNRAPLLNSDAVIAAFLPGTLGGDALVNAMLGDYSFRKNNLSNTLSFPWPRDMQDVINHFSNGALFPMGYGQSYK